MTTIGEYSRLKEHIGLVYADGNNMGQLVQELNTPELFRYFSTIVDQSIREACFDALARICSREISAAQQADSRGKPIRELPADILLLGGDDLLVAMPADRSLDFAMYVTKRFEDLTRQRIAESPAPVQRFFEEHTGKQGLTISCGIAIGSSKYPFYLLLDLAEQLLANAKRFGTLPSHNPTLRGAEARVDFHLVTGGNSYSVDQIRSEDYRIKTEAPRTLRPLTREQLQRLREGVIGLHAVNFPRSKLHDLLGAALDPLQQQSGRKIREIFSRCKHSESNRERQALWDAVERLCPAEGELDFPWIQYGGKQWLPLADLVEAFDQFSDTGESNHIDTATFDGLSLQREGDTA